MAHGAAEPGVRLRRRGPDALDQAAKDDAIDVLQSCFERPIYANAYVRDLRAPCHAIANRDPKELGIVCQCDDNAGVSVRTCDVVECLQQLHAVSAGEGRWLTSLVAAQGGNDVAMPCGKIGEGPWSAG